jgi:NhaA family Na+:H+ antiporter
MATDIAFAVGALALLGKRVTPAIRILLLALAVIDDVGAIVVIALFYSTNIFAMGFAVVGLGILATIAMQLFGVRSSLAYFIPGVIIWAGTYLAGIHPTLAGVAIGFMTPVRAWYGADEFLNQTEAGVRSLRDGIRDDHALMPHLDTLKTANREAVSPVERLQHSMHGWVAFGIMPLFALANAGVPLAHISFAGDSKWVFWGVAIGLTVGKPLGIVTVSWLTARCGLTSLPNGVRWSHITVVGMVGGIGFTMALFIAQLAFLPGPELETAKFAILCGSILAGILSLISGHKVLRFASDSDCAVTAAEAEASTIK